MFFESNLPEKAPLWLDARCAAAFTATMQKIHARMNLLECALDVSGMKGETFAKYAKRLFDVDQARFDFLSAEDIAGFAAMMDDGTEEPDRMEWPNAVTVVDSAFVSTPEWESIRHIGIGGSDAAVVLGVSPYRTPRGLYHDKVGTPRTDGKGDEDSWVFDRGHIMEDRVVEAFCNLTGAKVVPETRMFASKKYPNCTANIDAIIRFDDGRMYVFEAKTTIAENWKAWADGKIPPQYLPQMRQYPAVLDDDRILGTYIGCLFTKDSVAGGVYLGSLWDGKEFVARYVDRDPVAEAEQLASEERWFGEYVATNDVPPMEGGTQELETLRAFAPKSDVKKQEWLLDEVSADIQEYMRLKKEQSDAKKRADAFERDAKAISLRFIEKLNGSTEATVNLADGKYYEVKNAPRSKTSVDTESLDVLIDAAAPLLPAEMLDKFRGCIVVNPDATRVFSIKEKALKKAKKTS